MQTGMTYEQDISRRLSFDGVTQSRRRRDVLADFNFTASSPAHRCVDTAHIIGGCPSQIIQIDQMSYDPHRLHGRELNATFAEIGYAPLATYLKHPNGSHILQHGILALEAVRWAVISHLPPDPTVIKTLVCGHAPLIAALGLSALSQSRMNTSPKLQMLLNRPFGETEGFRLVWENTELIECTFYLD